MKKIIIIFLAIFLCIPIVSNAVATNSSSFAKEKIYILYDSSNCKECNQYKETLEEYYKNDNRVYIEYISVDKNQELVKKIKKNLNIKRDKFPITIIGTTYFKGFNQRIMKKIKRAVQNYQKEDKYCDIVDSIKNQKNIEKCLKDNQGINQENHMIIVIGLIIIAILICLISFKKKKMKSK